MAKVHELQAQLGKAVDELQLMAAKSEADGFEQDVFDALTGNVEKIKEQIERVKRANAIAANLASPVDGQDRMTPEAPPSAHKLYGTLKNFKDREIAGIRVRAIDQAYAAGMWFKGAIFEDAAALEWCKGHGMAVVKAQGEGVDSAGGFLVPEELLANIIVLREQFGVFRQQCRVIPMGRDTLNWPRRTGGLTASFTSENTAITESSATWDNVNLTAKKLGALVRMSTEIEEDAVVSIADWLVGEIAYAFAAKEDDCGFNGDGTSTYGGMRGCAVLLADSSHTAGAYTTSSATLTSLVVADFTGTMGKLPQYALPGAKWYMSQQMFYSAAGTALAKGGGNTIATLATDPMNPRLLGFPVVIAQKLPVSAPGTGKVQFMFGDLSKSSALGERRGVTIARSDQRYFDTDQIGLRGTERFDINNHDLGDTTNAGPLVAGISP